jgi:hypothetical protein
LYHNCAAAYGTRDTAELIFSTLMAVEIPDMNNHAFDGTEAINREA